MHVCVKVRLCVFMKVPVLLSSVSLLFIALLLTHVLVSVTLALMVHSDGPKQATGKNQDESQWKICQLVIFRLLQSDG